ncbi:MAG TPA: hypothetical protein VGE01_13025 [Fimbriimonas sp.]
MNRAQVSRLAFCTVLGAATGYGLWRVVPQRYEALASIRVAPEASLNRHAALLQSQAVIARAIDRASRSNPGAVREVSKLPERVAVDIRTATRTLDLRVWMESPRLSMESSTALVRALSEASAVQVQERQEQRARALEAAVETTQNRLADNARRIRELRSTLKESSVGAQMAADARDAKELEKSLQALSLQIQSARREIAALPEARDPVRPPAPSNRIRQLEAAYRAARDERDRLQAEYMPDAPEMRAGERRLAVVSRMLAQARAERAALRDGEAPSNDSVQSRARLTALENSAGAIRGELALIRKSLREYPKKASELKNLDRKQTELRRIAESYLAALRQARSRSLQPRPPIELVSPPHLDEAGAARVGFLFVAFGALAGLALGAFWNRTVQRRSMPIRSLRQLKAVSSTPIFTILPEQPRRLPKGDGPIDESYRRLLAHFDQSVKRPYRLGVVGIAESSGATTIAAIIEDAAQREGLDAAIVGLGHGEREVRDLAIYDLEPIRGAGVPTGVAAQLDELLLLVRENAVGTREFVEAQKALGASGCPAVTVILTRSMRLRPVSPTPPKEAAARRGA